MQLRDKWENMSVSQLVGRAGEMIEDMRQAKAFIGLVVPAAPETVSAFFRMFTCQRCHDPCCERQTQEGIVLLPGEVDRIAGYLGISNKQFKRDYTFTTRSGRFLKYPCPFFVKDPSSCKIFTVYPQVCRFYPVNQPTAILCVNSDCPEGRRVAEIILEYQAGVVAEREKFSG